MRRHNVYITELHAHLEEYFLVGVKMHEISSSFSPHDSAACIQKVPDVAFVARAIVSNIHACKADDTFDGARMIVSDTSTVTHSTPAAMQITPV